MKTAGLIGGMSWESTVGYYQIINQGIKAALGGLHSGKILLNSLDFSEIEACQRNGDWDKTAAILVRAAQSLALGGADFILICTNTMHKVYEQVAREVDIPLVHIADATAQCLQEKGIEQVGLLGTRFTMEESFYTARLQEHGINVIVPDDAGRARVHDVIYQELCLGVINEASKHDYLHIMDALSQRGAQAIILGCTEIGLLVKQNDTPITLVDTTYVHAQKAVELMLNG